MSGKRRRPVATEGLRQAPETEGVGRLAAPLVKAAVFICGAVLMALEIVGSRILAPYFGNSIFVWGSLISIFLAALSLGYYFGGALSARRARFGVLAALIAVPGILILVLPFFYPAVNKAIAASDLGVRLNPLVASTILFLLPSIFLGTISPYAIRLSATAVATVGATAGVLYAISTLGSILGTLVTAFWLIPALGVSNIVHTLGATLLALAVVLFAYEGRRLAAVGVLVVAVVPGVPLVWQAGSAVRDTQTIFEKDSFYHRMRVVDDVDVRYLYFDHMRQSGMALADPDRLQLAYTRYMTLALAFRPEARRLLFIGLGGGSLPKWFHRALPQAEVDVAEIDPEVVEVAKRFFRTPEDPRLRLYAQDGRLFVLAMARRYDLVFLDAYFVDALPFHLVTREFFREVQERLAPGGVLALNVIGAITGPQSRLYRSIVKTLRKVYVEVYTIPVIRPEEPGEAGVFSDTVLRNLIVVATQERRGWGRPELIRAAERLVAQGLLPAGAKGYAAQLLEREVPTDDVPVLEDEYAPVDNLMHF
ncbi:MAG: fused MFS/spermidine synthase [Deltaproteobacteria bacterium]|nr:fused MFS/spermidine synthase [Deltaproteobacteria bacterium]MBI3076848.1 fused MFS/spermidine synthase [Deltaproteobacteria bacterium]